MKFCKIENLKYYRASHASLCRDIPAHFAFTACFAYTTTTTTTTTMTVDVQIVPNTDKKKSKDKKRKRAEEAAIVGPVTCKI
jgi:hypothetical protein